jgi:hypothetical protein
MNSTLYTPIISHVNCFSCTVHQLYNAQLISVVVALSSCEAEYLACSHCARQILWLCSLFYELGFTQEHPTPLYCDNQGTVACSHDPQSHSRMKLIDIRAHFIRDSVNRRLVDVHHIPGSENPADLLSKPLAHVIHVKWIERIGMHRNHPLDN